MRFPVIPCDLCGSPADLPRAQVKAMLDEWERRSPGRRPVVFRALDNLRHSHLANPTRFDFTALMGGGNETPRRPFRRDDFTPHGLTRGVPPG